MIIHDILDIVIFEKRLITKIMKKINNFTSHTVFISPE